MNACLTRQRNAEDDGCYAGRTHGFSLGYNITYTSLNANAKSCTEGKAKEAVSDVTGCRVVRTTTTDESS